MKQLGFWPDEFLDDLVEYWHGTEIDPVYGFMDFICRRLNWTPGEFSTWVTHGIVPAWWLQSWWAGSLRARVTRLPAEGEAEGEETS